MEAKSYFGSVLIKASNTLAETANTLSTILDGFSLQEEQSGRFEEYPAFVDKKGPISIELVGNAPGESSGFYSLTVTGNKIDAVEFGIQVPSKFIQTLPADLNVEKNGYINISKYLCAHISPFLSCNIAWIT